MGELLEVLAVPEYLKERAGTMEGLLQKVHAEYTKMGEIALATESCFKGKSADKIRERMTRKKEEGIRLIEEMMAFPVKLTHIAEEYSAAERENKDAADRTGNTF